MERSLYRRSLPLTIPPLSGLNSRSGSVLPSGYSASSWRPLLQMMRAGFEQVMMQFPPDLEAALRTRLRRGPAEGIEKFAAATARGKGLWQIQPEDRAGVRTPVIPNPLRSNEVVHG